MNRKKKQLDSNCRPAGFFGMLYLCNRSPTLSNKPMTSKNTIVIATGTTYLMTRNQRANSWFRFVDPTLISRNNVSLGILVKVKTAIANAPKGIKIFETIESRKSKIRSEEHTSELQSRGHLVCRLLLDKKTKK